MLIVCPSCASRYSIDDDKIGPSGRTVRCASCRTGFFVRLGEAANPAPRAPSRADDEAASGLLGRLQAEGEQPAPGDTQGDTAGPGDLDAGSLDQLFETELAAAKQEAEAAAMADAPRSTADQQTAVTGWQKFLPGQKKRAQDLENPEMKPAGRAAARTVAGSANRGASLFRQTSASARPSHHARLKGPLGLGIAGAIVLAGAILQREMIVRAMPGTAPLFSAISLPVNLKGLEFADVRSTTQTEGETRLLIVEGRVRSIHSDLVNVPLIEIRLRGTDGRTLYTWTTDAPRKSLKPGEALHFRTRLATPPEAGRDVEVRFTDKLQSATSGS